MTRAGHPLGEQSLGQRTVGQQEGVDQSEWSRVPEGKDWGSARDCIG